MRLDRTSTVLNVIGEGGDPLGGAPVESFLAQYSAVVLYSEMEEKLAELIRMRLAAYTHEAIAAFITGSLADMVRRTSKAEIAKFTARFGEPFKVRFNELVDERLVTRYSNVIEARHDIGHRRGSNITLSEVRQGLEAANHILAALVECFDTVCGRIQ